MDTNGLLFIPDISGFTRFVNETEIEHSRYIISELLENIINSNQIGLIISEIEGDAVLFYRFGSTPSPEEIYAQIEKMFCNFQQQLKNYEVRRACQCSACMAAVNLSLKIITHYGEFSTYNINEYNKLFGKDVIVAHRLLKNDIERHEYWLVTNDLFNSINTHNNLPQWINWQHGNKQTDGEDVVFHYSLLSQLKDQVQPNAGHDYTLGNNGIKIFSQSKMIDAPAIMVLSVIGDFSLRSKWMDGVTEISQVSHPINHVGVKHRQITGNRAVVFYSSSFNEHDGAYTYSETDEKKNMEIYFTVTPQTGNKTLVVVDYFLKRDTARQLYFSLFLKKKLSRQFINSLNNLERLTTEPGVGYNA